MKNKNIFKKLEIAENRYYYLKVAVDDMVFVVSDRIYLETIDSTNNRGVRGHNKWRYKTQDIICAYHSYSYDEYGEEISEEVSFPKSLVENPEEAEKYINGIRQKKEEKKKQAEEQEQAKKQASEESKRREIALLEKVSSGKLSVEEYLAIKHEKI